MSGPYLCFRVNRASRAILTETIKYEPDPMVSFTNPFEWFVVCDSADKVVIRSLVEGRQALAVIAIAQLRGLHLEDRQQSDPALPTTALWTWLEDVVFPTREHGHARARVEAFDPAELSAAAPPPPEPDAVWQLAATAMAPLRTPSPTARPAPAATPLWSPVATPVIAPATARYLEFVFDHATVRVVPNGIGYVPDPSLRPVGRYQMKVACDAQGQVRLQVAGEQGLVVIAAARWRDGALCDREQQGREPDDFQWIALEDALRAELARAP